MIGPLRCRLPTRDLLTPMAVWLSDDTQLQCLAVLSEGGLIWFEREPAGDLQLVDVTMTGLGRYRQIESRVEGDRLTVACLRDDGSVAVYVGIARLEEPAHEQEFAARDALEELILGARGSVATVDSQGVVRRLR